MAVYSVSHSSVPVTRSQPGLLTTLLWIGTLTCCVGAADISAQTTQPTTQPTTPPTTQPTTQPTTRPTTQPVSRLDMIEPAATFADEPVIEFTAMTEQAQLVSEAPTDAVIDATTIFATAQSDNVHYRVSFNLGNSVAIIVGNWHSPRFENILGPTLPPNSNRMFYYGGHSSRDYEMLRVGQRHRRDSFQLEDEPGYKPTYSPDGQYLFAWVTPGKHMRLQVNDELEPIFDNPSPDSFVMSPDGRQWAYAAQQGSGGIVVRNGQPGKPYNMVSTLMSFSPDSQRFGHVSATIRGWAAVVDGEPGPFYSQIRPPIVFSPDSKRFAYSARREDGVWVVVVDGQENEATYAQRHGGIVFSPDSAHVAAYLKNGHTWSIIVDNQVHRAYDAIGKNSLVFSKDGSRHAYAAQRNGQWYTVLDGQELDPNESLLSGSFRFSPDARRFAYVAKHNGYWRIVLDGMAHAPFQSIEADSVQFSHDSRRLAYVGKLEGLPRVVVDRQEKPAALNITQLTFSPDGQHLAWLAQMPDGWMLQVDDIAGQYRYAQPVPDAQIVFDSDTQLHTVVAFPQEGRFFRIDATMNAQTMAVAE